MNAKEREAEIARLKLAIKSYQRQAALAGDQYLASNARAYATHARQKLRELLAAAQGGGA